MPEKKRKTRVKTRSLPARPRVQATLKGRSLVRPKARAKPQIVAKKKMSARAPAPPLLQPEDLNFGFVDASDLYVCLRCALELLMKRLGLAARTAYAQLKQYTPPVEDLAQHHLNPPQFLSVEPNPRCPHCDATTRLLARMRILRLEMRPEAEGQCKALIKKLKQHSGTFAWVEHRRSPHDLFFERLSLWQRQFNLDDEDWLKQTAAAYLQRAEPEVNWKAVLQDERREPVFFHHMDERWKIAGNKLGLSMPLYGDILVVQYLLSRSHKSGGLTLAGRLTVYDLLYTLRRIGYLQAKQIDDPDPYSAFEKVVDAIANAQAVKVLYIFDRTEYLEQIKAAYKRLKT